MNPEPPPTFIFSFAPSSTSPKKKGLKNNQIEDLKESLTFLLNEPEFEEIILSEDTGYPEHIKLRKKLKSIWLKDKNFQNLIDEGCLNMPEKIGIQDKEITNLMFKLMNSANTMFVGNGNEIQLIHQGEASCLALSKLMNERKIKNVLAIDERTTRMLVEKPGNLKELLEKKLHAKIKLRESNFQQFKGFKIIRSTELMYLAYKNNLIRWEGKEILDALLYALKFKGCAISSEEIEEIKRIK